MPRWISGGHHIFRKPPDENPRLRNLGTCLSAVEHGFSVATWMCITLTKGESILHCSPSFWEHTPRIHQKLFLLPWNTQIHIQKDVENPWLPIWTMIYIGGVSHLYIYILYIYIIYNMFVYRRVSCRLATGAVSFRFCGPRHGLGTEFASRTSTGAAERRC